MADVPDQPVSRRVEDVVECHRQLHNTQSGAQMPTVTETMSISSVRSFIGQLPEVAARKRAQLARLADAVQ